MVADQRTSNPGVGTSEGDKAVFRHRGEYVVSFDERKAKILEMLRKEHPDEDHTEIQVGLPRVRRCNSSLEYTVTSYYTYQGNKVFLRQAVMIPEDPLQEDVDATILEHIWNFAPEAVKKLAPRTIGAIDLYEEDSALDRMYVLLGGPALYGLPLSCVYDKLSRKQKVSVASQLGRVYREVQRMRTVGCGYPELHLNEGVDDKDDPAKFFRQAIQPYQMTMAEGDEMKKTLPEKEEKEDESDSETYLASADDVVLTRERLANGPEFHLKARQILILQLKRWIHLLHHRHSVDHDDDKGDDQCGLLQCALYMAREIIARNPDVFEPKDGDGSEDDHPNMCLHNPYLGTPENIMVQFRPGRAVPTITGIWDWGASAFDPQFASCRPPSWLWRSGVPSKEAKAAETEKETYASVAAAAPPPAPPAPATTDNGDAGELATVQIRGLPEGRPWPAQRAELRPVFAKFGRITSMHVACNRETGLTRNGWAKVTYADPAEAAKACRQMHGQPLPARLDEQQQQQQQQPQEDSNTKNVTTDNETPPKLWVCIDTLSYNDSHWKPHLGPLDACDRLAETVQQAHASRDTLWYDRRGDEPLDPTAIKPTDPAGSEIKRAFDEAVGTPFRRVAYNPDMAFARNLYAVVRDRPWRRAVVGHNLKVLEDLVTAWYEREAERAANFDDDDEEIRVRSRRAAVSFVD
ncbi:translation initiation factor eIF3 subunit [Apiospora saccharicola]